MNEDGSAQVPQREPYVFLNCPFDSEYEPMLHAMMLAVLSCGFVPRVADEFFSGAPLRVDRICEALHGSRLSIHDLSRCKGEGDENLARLNMPLELGMAMGRQYATLDDPERIHDWFVLTPSGHSYVKYISDLAGVDPGVHDGTPSAIIPVIMRWLLTAQGTAGVNWSITPRSVVEALPKLDTALGELDFAWSGVRPPWIFRVQTAREIVATLDRTNPST